MVSGEEVAKVYHLPPWRIKDAKGLKRSKQIPKTIFSPNVSGRSSPGTVRRWLPAFLKYPFETQRMSRWLLGEMGM